jgi:hypothetical protein
MSTEVSAVLLGKYPFLSEKVTQKGQAHFIGCNHILAKLIPNRRCLNGPVSVTENTATDFQTPKFSTCSDCILNRRIPIETKRQLINDET